MTGFEHLLTPDNLVTFLTLTFLEIVLAGDNLVLIAIMAGRLPEHQRPLARRLGLFAAVATRILLLFSLFWLSHIETPLRIASDLVVTPRQIIFGVGGAFLILKAFAEIFEVLFNGGHRVAANAKPAHHAFFWVLTQIAIFDVIFSLDSVIAAIGIAQQVEIMVAAVLVATTVMFFLVNPISDFIDRHRIVKLIALNLLILIGVLLVAEAAHYELPRVELYAIFGLAVAMQALALWVGGLRAPLRQLLTILLLGVVVGGAALVANNDALARGAPAKAVLDEAANDTTAFVADVQSWIGD